MKYNEKTILHNETQCHIYVQKMHITVTQRKSINLINKLSTFFFSAFNCFFLMNIVCIASINRWQSTKRSKKMHSLWVDENPWWKGENVPHSLRSKCWHLNSPLETMYSSQLNKSVGTSDVPLVK
jgi:hypothetical protein